MSTNDRLDTAIDQVAARMVHVSEDADLTERIVGALPERRSRFHLRATRFGGQVGGQVGWLIPQLAAITAVAVAAIVWTSRDTATPSLLSSSQVAALTAMPGTVAALAPGTALRTQLLERLEPLELVEPLDSDGADHERSLAPIEAMSALVMSDMDPDALPGSPALVLAPIAITELPLTAESFSPR